LVSVVMLVLLSLQCFPLSCLMYNCTFPKPGP
jgi:hypothetical protein